MTTFTEVGVVSALVAVVAGVVLARSEVVLGVVVVGVVLVELSMGVVDDEGKITVDDVIGTEDSVLETEVGLLLAIELDDEGTEGTEAEEEVVGADGV